MIYEVQYNKQIEKTLLRILKSNKRAFSETEDLFTFLETDPRPKTYKCKKLTDFDEYRIKIESHRVIYEIDDQSKVIIILKLGHRKEIYR